MKALRYTALALLAVLLLGCSKTDLGPITREQALLICNGHAPPAYPEPVISASASVVPYYGEIDGWNFAKPRSFGPTGQYSSPLFYYYGYYGRPFEIRGFGSSELIPRHYCYYSSVVCFTPAPKRPVILGYVQIVNTYTGQLLGWQYWFKDYGT